jgi:hypothetical protein
MFGRNVKIGTMIRGRKVVKTMSGHATFYVKGSRFTAPARFVWFAGASHPVAYEADRPVPGAIGYAESLPAGGVASKNVRTPEKVRASDKRWRGESVHGMPTREHDLIAGTSMYDAAKVNGTVGAARGGVGPESLTGRSF